MITRQTFIYGASVSAAAAVGAPLILQACSSQGGAGGYEAAVQSIWHPIIARASKYGQRRSRHDAGRKRRA
jgi:hypothetical protein